MSPKPRIRPEAERDIGGAAAWYEGQREGLGHEFLDEVARTIKLIARTPSLYPLVHRQTRRALLNRFPFAVFYRVDGQQLMVVAVMHAKRSPRHWKSRE